MKASANWLLRLSRTPVRPAAPLGPANLVPSGMTAETSIGLPISLVRQAPMALKFSRLKPKGSILVWQEAQTGLERCISICSRTVIILPFLTSFSEGMFGGGAGGGAARIFSSTHLPRSTTEVRLL